MTPSYLTTVRNGLRYMLGVNQDADIDLGFQALATDVDQKIVGYSQGTLAARPAPSIPNRFYRDTGAGVLYHDTGTEWEVVVTTQALSTLSIVGPYSARVPRSPATPYPPSATRPTLVVLTVKLGVSGETVGVYVTGGTTAIAIIREPGEGGLAPKCLSFIVAAGASWEYTGAGAAVKSSYLTL